MWYNMTITVEVPDPMRDELEKKKEDEYYSSISELVREALREYLNSDNNLSKKEEAVLELVRQGKIEKVELEGEAKQKVEEGLEELEKR